MNYDGESIKYTAFALVAIESVWPNPDGNELSPDDYDLSLLGAEKRSSAGKARNQFSPQLQELSSIENERDYYDTRGYYKLIPMNVVSVKTSATTGGSNFSVTFTLDDLLLVSSLEQGYLSATGLPVSAAELVESDLVGRVPDDFLSQFSDSSGTRWEYKKDSELGLTRYKIDGASSSFNIEDLVDANDTVTIWLYHDPSDFYSKDADAMVNETELRLNQEITNIVGSADRRGASGVSEQNFEQTLLGNLGLINEYVAESIRSVVELNTGDETEQIPRITRENLDSALTNFVQAGIQGTIATDKKERLRSYTQQMFENEDEGNFVFDKFLSYYYDPTQNFTRLDTSSGGRPNESLLGIETPTASTTPIDTSIGGAAPLASDLVSTREARQQIIATLNRLNKHPDPSFLYDQTHLTSDVTRLMIRLQGYSLTRPSGEEFILAANTFVKKLNDISDEYARKYAAESTTFAIEQNFSNGRNVLVNKSHGETPYLAVKGHISSVEVAIGAAQGSHIVTLNGNGYEKILNENEIYYEDTFYTGAAVSAAIDFNVIYVNMTPAAAISNIINRWAAKQVIIGKKTNYTVAAVNRFLHLGVALNSKLDTIEDAEQSDEDLEDIDRSPLENSEIPIRGNFVLSEFPETPSTELIRLYSPINYLDTTRIVEMINSINESYTSPEAEAVINTAVALDTRKSIMENIRKVGGVGQFYELFVDETGRVRYRLSFEAWERTPQPEYTPILQDRDILSEGAKFSRGDSNLATMVDVRPIRGNYSAQYYDIGWNGRSVPRKGKVPLQDLGRLNELPETLAPELFKYGLRTIKIDDVYTPEKGGANRKATLYRLFYEEPIKKVQVNTRLNPAYRPGETVLMSLQRTKHRSRTPINISATLDWLNKLKAGASTEWGRKVMKSYIGVDNRLRNTDSYALTRNYSPIPDDNLYQKYMEDPYMFVLDHFIKTFEFLSGILGNINVITPEYFPNTYWFFTAKTGRFFSWNENRLEDIKIMDFYGDLLRASVRGSKASADNLNSFIAENEGIINAIKFQNFRAASYYIQGVTHNYQFGSAATTSLSLDYGQDNLVLLEPKHMLPIGFLSIEKNMRIGYDDEMQQEFWLEKAVGNTDSDSEFSALQNMYVNQLEADRNFKSGSFLHSSSVLRNSSIYMHEIAERAGLDYGITITTEQSPLGGRGVVTTPNPTLGVPEFSSGANDPRAIAYRVASELNIDDEQLIEDAANAGTGEETIRRYLLEQTRLR